MTHTTIRRATFVVQALPFHCAGSPIKCRLTVLHHAPNRVQQIVGQHARSHIAFVHGLDVAQVLGRFAYQDCDEVAHGSRRQATRDVTE